MRFCGAESEINAFITTPADPLRERYECLVVNVVDGLETHGVRAEFGANRIVDGLCKHCCIFLRKRAARIESQRLRRRRTTLVDAFTPFGWIALRRNSEFKAHIYRILAHRQCDRFYSC